MGAWDNLKEKIKTMSGFDLTKSTENRRILVGVIIFVMILLLVVTSVLPRMLHLTAGDVAPSDIRATRTIVNRKATETLKNERIAAVPMVYDLDLSIIDAAETEVNQLFAYVKELKGDNTVEAAQRPVRLKETLDFDVSDDIAHAVIRASASDLDRMNTATNEALRAAMQGGIKEEQYEDAYQQMSSRIRGLTMNADQRSFVLALAQNKLTPNMLFNENETNRRIQLEIEAVEENPIMVLKDQVVVRSGEIVTEEQIAILEDLGLQRSSVDFGRVLGLALFVTIMLALLGGYMYQNLPEHFYNESDLVLLGVISVLALVINKVLGSISGFLIPVAGGSMLVAILLDRNLAYMFTLVISVLSGIVIGGDIRFILVALVGGFAGIFSVPRLTQRSDMTRAGFMIAAANVFTIFAVAAVAGTNLYELLLESAWGAMGIFSGLISAVLAIGALPYLENTFGITTPIRLAEIANPNHPLLRRLLMEAPGTYHHSIMVGNLAESAAEEVGAEPLLARVGSYFHDIGKIKRPQFFIENQLPNSNPHDKVTPSLSAMIITSHLQDGVELAKEYRLPGRIIDLIQQHHGTGLVSYFYYMASEKGSAQEEILEEDYRYQGPKPQSKEAALILLADSVEAAVRSYPKADVEKMEQVVRRIIRNRLDDGQLDDSDLTLKDLDRIGDTFIRILMGTFHSRIEYPEDLPELVKEREDNAGDLSEQSAGPDPD